jgi:hypothetical protein
MSSVRSSKTQSGADTTSFVTIETNIVADGKSGWEMFALEVYWSNGESVASADWEASGVITTSTATPSFSSPDEVARVSWGVQNTGGVAVAVPYEPIKQLIFIEPRITVQPILYFQVFSTLTAQANVMDFRLYYNIVKLTDLEVLRLLAGGA